MDVGLNNTNKLHLALEEPMLEDVEWLVEANSNETYLLWEKYCDQAMSAFSPIVKIEKKYPYQIEELRTKLNPFETIILDVLLKLNRKVSQLDRKRFNWEQISQGHGFEIVKLD